MVFNSIDFFLFFLLVLGAYFSLPHRHRWWMLLGASYFFYMYWNAAFAALMLLSTVIDYAAALWIHQAPSKTQKRIGLAVTCGSNLGMLFFFKYWNFFAESLGWLSTNLELGYRVPTLDILLPVGISFYTFQTMSYTIDVYRGQLAPERHFGRFALYVTFFPQLVAGPIERATALLPQFSVQYYFDWERFYSGWQRIIWGLFKKVVIADRLAIYVDAVYNNPGQHNSLTCLLATYAFAFQIYCDFSGYSDIAIGSARILGFDLMENFRQPYFSTSIKEFWRRWHISLSTWLRDYLYIPLGGNRGGPARMRANLMIVMLLGGLWHGASWNFVIWGALQGVLLVLSHAYSESSDALWRRWGVADGVRDVVKMTLTFHLVCLSWVFFRANTFGDAMTILASIARWDRQTPFADLNVFAHASLGLLVLLAVDAFQAAPERKSWQLSSFPVPVRWACWYSVLLMIVFMGVVGNGQFIYFQF